MPSVGKPVVRLRAPSRHLYTPDQAKICQTAQGFEHDLAAERPAQRGAGISIDRSQQVSRPGHAASQMTEEMDGPPAVHCLEYLRDLVPSHVTGNPSVYRRVMPGRTGIALQGFILMP
jgi:hypothetical protein